MEGYISRLRTSQFTIERVRSENVITGPGRQFVIDADSVGSLRGYEYGFRISSNLIPKAGRFD
jgi:hypothetical protein